MSYFDCINIKICAAVRIVFDLFVFENGKNYEKLRYILLYYHDKGKIAAHARKKHCAVKVLNQNLLSGNGSLG